MHAQSQRLPQATTAYSSGQHRSKLLLVMVGNANPGPSAWQTLIGEIQQRADVVGEVLLVPYKGISTFQLMNLALRCRDDVKLKPLVVTVREPAETHADGKRMLLGERQDLGDKDVYVTLLG